MFKIFLITIYLLQVSLVQLNFTSLDVENLNTQKFVTTENMDETKKLNNELDFEDLFEEYIFLNRRYRLILKGSNVSKVQLYRTETYSAVLWRPPILFS